MSTGEWPKDNSSLARQRHSERYPFILHWRELPVCKETMDWLAGRMVAALHKYIDEKLAEKRGD